MSHSGQAESQTRGHKQPVGTASPSRRYAAQIRVGGNTLADIERGFHVVKSAIEISTVFHRLPGRIRRTRASASRR